MQLMSVKKVMLECIHEEERDEINRLTDKLLQKRNVSSCSVIVWIRLVLKRTIVRY